MLSFRHGAEEKNGVCLRMDLTEVSALQVSDSLKRFLAYTCVQAPSSSHQIYLTLEVDSGPKRASLDSRGGQAEELPPPPPISAAPAKTQV